MNRKEDDSRLARWANKTLSKEELEQLRNEEELSSYQQILDEVDTWSLPKLSSGSYEKLKAKRARKKQRQLVSIPSLLAAAMLVFALGIWGLYKVYFSTPAPFQVIAATGVLVHELPDGSKVSLNKGAQLAYHPKDWLQNREVELQGNAYFEVTSGQAFRVVSPQGQVEVLGTKFEIIDHKRLYSVYCNEGKVRTIVRAARESQLLTPGKGLLYHNNEVKLFDKEQLEAPSWTLQQDKDTYSYDKAMLFEVIRDLEQAFDVEINSKVSLNRVFSGKFVADNLNEALETVFLPLGIRFEVSPEGLVTLY